MRLARLKENTIERSRVDTPEPLPFASKMLKGRAAVVTGSTSGIGLGIAGGSGGSRRETSC